MLSLLSISFKYIPKFGIYYLYYETKLEITKSTYNLDLLYTNRLASDFTWFSLSITSYFYFRYGLNNLISLLATFSFAYNGRTYITQPSLVTNKGEPSRTALGFSHRLQLLSFLPSLMLSKIRPVISKSLAMSKYIAMSKW